MEHTKEWHLKRVTVNQRAAHVQGQRDIAIAAYAQGQLMESVSQAAHAGVPLEEIKAARAAA